ncbi:MAG TPA: TAXI family TRAP transporter solute-binding subunit [Dehalococcoidia bacterium]|nr:TAXI family TRAP transporter solute-binding subunit [Dehalococcoidia bacterium]
MNGKHIVFAGAAPIGAGTPWGTLALVVKKALEPLGYDVDIEILSWGANNPRYVSDGRADLGATQYRAIEEAMRGVESWAGEEPRSNLRLIATINQPAWIGAAVRAETGITDLGDIGRKQLPIRLKTGREKAITSIEEYYGISAKKIVEWGGRIVAAEAPQQEAPADPFARWLGRDWNQIAPWVASGDFDVIIDPIYAAYTPEHKHWWEATMLHEMRFLPLPDDLIQEIVAKNQAEAAGFIPHRLMRGVNEDVATVQRFPQAIYTREEADEDFVYEVTKALDDASHLFRETHIPYSHHPKTVAKPRAVPLHTGAKRYYDEAGYPA